MSGFPSPRSVDSPGEAAARPSGIGIERRHLYGIALMLVATALFSLMHAVTKALAPHYPALQLAAMRGMASLPWVMGWLLMTGMLGRVLEVRLPLHLLRAVFALVTVTGVTFALKALPIANAYTISFAASLLVTLLSILVLGERVDGRRWLAVLVGFAGVLIVLRPSTDPMLTLAGFAMLASAIGYACSTLTVRVIVRTDAAIHTVFWMVLLLSLSAGLLALPDWRNLRAGDVLPIAAIGLLGFLGQYAVTTGLRFAPASVMAPFEYTALLWALVLDWALWGTQIAPHVLLGAVLIVSTGLYLVLRARSDGERPPP